MYSKIKVLGKTINKTILVIAVAASSIGAVIMTATSAQAMVVYNCTTDQFPVTVTGENGGKTQFTSKPGQRKNVSLSRSRGPFRVSVNVIGPDQKWSNRSHNDIFALKYSNSGNLYLAKNISCAQPKDKPVIDEEAEAGEGNRICFGSGSARFCLEQN